MQDLELEHAHKLSDVLRELRANLTDEAANRVLRWSLERYGVTVETTLRFSTVPEVDRLAVRREPAHTPTLHSLPPLADEDTEPNGDTTCYFCGKVCRDQKGLAAHLRIVHKAKRIDNISSAA